MLAISLARGLFLLPLADVTGVAPPTTLRPIPGAPECVLGLADWRGALVTVLDLPGLLGEGRAGDSPWLVRLAPPLEHLALATPVLPTIGGEVDDGLLLEPATLLARAGSGKPVEPSGA